MARKGAFTTTATKPTDVMGMPLPGMRIGRYRGDSYDATGNPQWVFQGALDTGFQLIQSWSVSAQGLSFIAKFETLFLKAFARGTDTVIGYNHVIDPIEQQQGSIYIVDQQVTFANGLTPGQCLLLLRQDLAVIEQLLRKLITNALTQHQYDALVSLGRNIGPVALKNSKIPHVINIGYYGAVAAHMANFVQVARAGQPITSAGLENRRREEVLLFATDPFLVTTFS